MRGHESVKNAMHEKQITFGPYGHMLTHSAVWSRDGQRIVYDVRSVHDGSVFDGQRIESVDVRSGQIKALYESSNGACCGVATYSPADESIVFIHGPEHPTPQWQYGFARRRGVIVRESVPGIAINLDARDLAAPFTPGALRGGTHLHLFSPDGRLVSFTYHDLLEATEQRNIGVSVLGEFVKPPPSHPRNHEGCAFSVVLTQTVAQPEPGSDQICWASEEAWLGRDGRRIAFQGRVKRLDGSMASEMFVLELPEDLKRGKPMQRRITFTQNGLAGPRHWLRSAPDGSRIGFLMRDDNGIVQFWTVTPSGGTPRQISHHGSDVESAFTWSPDGRHVAMIVDGCVGALEAESGRWEALTSPHAAAPRPEACVFSPDGGRIAYMRTVGGLNQIFVLSL
jgi:WD40 repeat protein